MKHIKKAFAFALTLVMAFALALPAFAATIDVQNVIDDETYTAYKILNYEANADKSAVSYYLTADQYDANEDGTAKDGGLGDILEDAGFEFTKSADGSQYWVSNSKDLSGSDVAEIAAKLKADTRLAAKAIETKIATGADGKANFTNLGTGYYFITSSAGSLAALHDEAAIETVVEKNTVTTTDKKQGNKAGTYANDQLDKNIGDTVYYDAQIIIGKGANYEITGTDTLPTGLTLNHGNDDITVKVADTGVSADNYTLNATDTGFTIKFKNTYIATLAEGVVIDIEYSAVINKDVAIRQVATNKFEIEYSNQYFDDSTVVKTYDVALKKTDGTKALDGAEFNVYTSEKEGTALKFKKDDTGYYLSTDNDASVTIQAGDGTGVNIRGLEPGTYWFEETVAPGGYNKLDARKDVTVTKDATAAVEIEVINNAGSVLPSTGGIGTTIFYIVGGIMVVGAVVVLLAKRRASSTEE